MVQLVESPDKCPWDLPSITYRRSLHTGHLLSRCPHRTYELGATDLASERKIAVGLAPSSKANAVVNMVIQSKSSVIREIRPHTGTHGGLSPAIHREEPHPVRPRYQYHKTCGSHCAIVQLDNRYSPAKQSIVSCSKSIYTLLVEATLFFYLCQHSFRHNCNFVFILHAHASLGARAGSRGSRFAPAL